MITVILNGYKRAENLNEQLEALKNQTLPPDEILFWYNNPGDNDLINYDIGTEIAGAYCNYNFGFVWRVLPDLTFENATSTPAGALPAVAMTL